MAPARKRKSDEMAEPTTPEASNTPAPKKMRITQTQKQALIDNLQLEITERARHLRAHYALQCADLKSRIERRVNRIPMSMRSMTMAELIAKHEPAPAPPAKPINNPKAQPTASRMTRKRKSSIVIAADPIPESSNENENDQENKIKTKTATLPKLKGAKRPGSRTGANRNGAGILSPRSHNSRTLPRSPIKPSITTSATTTTTTAADCVQHPQSPSKQTYHHNFSRPLSPLKPSSPLKSAAIATTSAITSSMHSILATAKSTATRGKATTGSSGRPQNPQRTVSQASNHSAVSNATATSTGTVVKGAATKETTTRSVRGRGAAAGAGTKNTAAALAEKVAATAPVTKSRTGTVKRGAAVAAAGTKKAVAAVTEPATGRRILRKRN